MILFALKKDEKDIRTIRFFHSVVQIRYLNWFLREEEYKYILLSQKIVTIGKITRDILEKCGNYSIGILLTGALLNSMY